MLTVVRSNEPLRIIAVRLKLNKKELDERIQAYQKASDDSSWTERQRRLFRELYGKATQAELAKIFNRKITSINNAATLFGVKRRKYKKWTDSLKNKLIKMREAGLSYEKIVAKLGVSRPSVTAKVAELGLKNKRYKRWTDDEIALLKKHYPNMTANDCLKHLPGRRINEVKVQIGRLKGLSGSKLRAWTKEEDKLALAASGSNEIAQLAAKLGRSTYAVYQRQSMLRRG